MKRVTHEELVIEAIRSSTEASGSEDKTFCRPSSVFYRLKGWMKPEDKLTAFSKLLEEKKIALSFNRYKRETFVQRSASLETRYGSIESFHPDTEQRAGLTRFCTSTKGRLLIHRYGRLPNDSPKFHYEYVWAHMYVRADGLPSNFPSESIQLW